MSNERDTIKDKLEDILYMADPDKLGELRKAIDEWKTKYERSAKRIPATSFTAMLFDSVTGIDDDNDPA